MSPELTEPRSAVAALTIPGSTAKPTPPWPRASTRARRRKKGAQAPARYARHHQDEPHRAPPPYLGRVWHRIGQPPTGPAAGPKRRVTDVGRVERIGRGRVAGRGATEAAAACLRYLQALDARPAATDRASFLGLATGPGPRRQASLAALVARAAWVPVSGRARARPTLTRHDRAWRSLKRDVHRHRARPLRAVVDEILAGRCQRGGTRLDLVDPGPDSVILAYKTSIVQATPKSRSAWSQCEK